MHPEATSLHPAATKFDLQQRLISRLKVNTGTNEADQESVSQVLS
jgi:hypothetical protein